MLPAYGSDMAAALPARRVETAAADGPPVSLALRDVIGGTAKGLFRRTWGVLAATKCAARETASAALATARALADDQLPPRAAKSGRRERILQVRAEAAATTTTFVVSKVTGGTFIGGINWKREGGLTNILY